MKTCGGCVQTRHGPKAVQSETGLARSFTTRLTGLDPAQIIHGNKVWPNLPGCKPQGQTWFVRVGVLWTKKVPASPAPSLLAGDRLSSATDWADKRNLFGLVVPWVFARGHPQEAGLCSAVAL